MTVALKAMRVSSGDHLNAWIVKSRPFVRSVPETGAASASASAKVYSCWNAYSFRTTSKSPR